MFIQITQKFWDEHPEIQDTHKVGDSYEIADDTLREFNPPNAVNINADSALRGGPDGEQQPKGSGSSVLDSLGEQFGFKPGKITATSRTKTLPSGAIATIVDFKGKHVTKAQRFLTANKDNGMDGLDLMPIIISLCTLIDGKPITPEDYDEMPGMDALELMGEFSAANFRQS